MPDITASDVTVTIDRKGIIARQKIHVATIVFGDGALTYPAGGIPVSDDALGFLRSTDSLQIQESDANGFRYEYDKSAKTIRILAQNIRTGSTAVAAAESGALVEDSNDAENADFRIPKTVIDTDYDIGPGKEVGTSHTPAATTLICEARGW